MEGLQHLTKTGKLTLALVLIQAVVIMALESIIAARYSAFSKTGTFPAGIPVYVILFITAQAFEIALVVDFVSISISRRCTYRIIAGSHSDIQYSH